MKYKISSWHALESTETEPEWEPHNRGGRGGLHKGGGSRWEGPRAGGRARHPCSASRLPRDGNVAEASCPPLSPGCPPRQPRKAPLAGKEGAATSARATSNGGRCHPLALGRHKKTFSYSAIQTALQRDYFIAATSRPAQDLPGAVISVTGVPAVGAGEAASFVEH